MERNTVLLEVSEYNKLRDFYRGIEEDRFVRIECYGETIYYAEETEIMAGLKTTIERLEFKLKSYLHPVPPKVNINDVKKMSYREFRKWRKS